MNMKPLWSALIVAAVSVGFAGCEREGTMERAGEEVDEAAETVKEGEESTEAKVDDAVDEMREGVNETVDEAKE